MRRWAFVCGVCAVMVLSIGAPMGLNAQVEDSVARAARQIFETVMSPYCPGRTISNCPSPQADELRDVITQKIAAGEEPEAIKEELYAIFGDELRTVPRARGFGLLAWFVPALAFLAGVWWIAGWLRGARAVSVGPLEPEVLELDAESDARIKAEMAELE